MPGPLSHIRVLDITRVLAGPWAAQSLGDLGAEIIKIERPGVGDDSRGFGPPFLKDQQGQATTDAVYFTCTNRNKKSVTVDIGCAEGQALIREMASKCDVLIENYKVGTFKRYGLSYEELSALNPGLIYCSLTGFGQDGPYAARPGYDLLFQGMAGLMSITGEMDGLPGAGPQKVGIAVSDIMAGMYCALAVTAAIAHRERTGLGQYIDISLMDTMVHFSSSAALNWLQAGVIPKRWGVAHPQIAPYQAFATSDGHMLLAVGSDSQFASFCAAVGRPDLGEDERFRTNPGRVTHRDALIAAVSEVMLTRSKKEWQSVFDAVGVPCGPINNMKEVFEEPPVIHRKLHQELPHAAAGKVATLASPMRMSQTPVEYRLGPPVLGEHTQQVLSELLGLSPERIAELQAKGAV
ncbi:MAG: CaiB/BaiF CoA-transferase family protein [Burkholderiaceae bacterium]|nr:CaiB/BaiF CoA-transferase family protein [Burkholderiaceae bacterium]